MENKPFMSSDWQKDFHIWFPGQNSLSDAERIYIQHKNRHTIITSKKKKEINKAQLFYEYPSLKPISISNNQDCN